MPVMLADYGPGGLTSVFIIGGSGLVVAVCIVGALITYFLNQKEAARSLLAVAGVVFLACWLLVILASILGRYFHLL
jgi:hypothetical protein